MRFNNIWVSSIVILMFVFSGCGGGGSSSEVVSTATNTAPIAKSIKLTTNEDITISANFDVTDAEDKYFQYEITQQPLHGTLLVEGEYNFFTYTPEAGFRGTDYFAYKAYDGASYSDEVNVTIEITELELVSQTDTSVPSNPVIISISSPSSNSISLFWSASSDAETASDEIIYEVHMSLDENFTTSESTKKLSIKGAQEATVLDLDESTLYYVKVKALDSGANSALSNEMSVETSALNSVVLNSSNVIKTASALFLNNTIVEDTNITFISDDKAIVPQEGDILVGTVDDTYLRKVTSVTENGDEVVLETKQVAMNEVFDELTLQSKTMLYDPSQVSVSTQAVSRYKSYSYNVPATQGYSWKSGKFAIEKNILSPSKLSIKQAPIRQEGSYVIISSASEDEIIVTSGELLQVTLLAELNNLSSTNFDENDVSRVLESFELVSVEHDGETSSNNFGFSMNTATLSLDKKEGTISFIATDAHASLEPYILTLRAKAKWYDTSLVLGGWKEDSEEIEIKVSVASKEVEATEGFSVSVIDDGTFTTYTLPIVGTLPPIKNEVEKSYSLKASAGVDVDFVPTLETELKLKEKVFSATAGGKMTLTIDSSFESSAEMTNSYEFNLDAINKKFIRVYLVGVVPVYQEVEILWKLVLTPSIGGNVNASNTFTQIFDVNFGVDCNADGCTPVSDNNASSTYTATVDIGAEASLEVRLIPEIRIAFYKAASTGITLEPWAKGLLQASGHAEYASDFSNYDMWSSYSLDTLDATIGMESKVFADLTVFDMSWLHYPSNGGYETIYTSDPMEVFSLPSISVEQPQSTQFRKNTDITLNALTQNGVNSHILSDSIEWYVYPSDGASISSADSPLDANVNFSEFGLYKVYFVANSNVLTSAFGRQSVEIEIDMRDEDSDGMADRWEDVYGLDATVDDSALDKDGDGYSNLFEYQNATDPQDKTSFPTSDATVDITTGLVAHYEFEGNANDSSGNLNHGTEYGGVTYVDGVLGQAASFDGVDDYIEVLFQNIYNESLSVSFWAKTSDITQCKENFGQTLIGHSLNGYVQNIQLCNDSLKTYAFTQNALDQNYTSNAKLNVNSWSNITYTIVKNGNINLYIDGVLQETFTAGNDVVSGDYITFGDLRPSRGLNYNGLIDDVRIYDRILNDSEITELYKRVTLPSETAITHNGIAYATVTSPYTGRVWLDRNLGASHVCTSLDDSGCYGNYYQWGRSDDGHQDVNSSLTSIQATDIDNAGNSFITDPNFDFSGDWALNVDSDGSLRAANWSKTDGSSVCPVGFRVPSISEIEAEVTNGSANILNFVDAFNSFLKLPTAGDRLDTNGSVRAQTTATHIWSTTTSGTNASYMNFYADSAYTYSYNRARGYNIRCIKDELAQNTPPTATDASITIEQDSVNNTITLSGSDADGDTLSYIVVTQPAHGSLSGTAPNLTYTPTSGYTGSDSFTFKVNDGSVDSNVATVSITVNATLILGSSTIKKTGQTLFYNENAIEVTDELTGLMWQDDVAVATVTKPWLIQASYDTCCRSNFTRLL